MSDVSEKTCPLCAEEMDLTDQQLKPCRCGYEICVWCWHHIMDMAEKDETEGRCPACRTPYDKERIVGTASKCERLVAEINMEKKLKSQKAKTKSSDGRKQLSSVRVIQRNLVYIVGLPLNLADEDLLIRKEYFGQYGKVLKVSISRTSAGTIQQFPNNSCSVYITYSKEVEAVRCIQSVHGFNLEGMSLRACFGTTKYCHSWLRNVPCTNPECLYLHEVGSTEDSFTKDEIISPYSRVQQITGISNNVQQRSGTFLPPPADEYTSNGSSMTEKPAVDSATSDLGINARVVSPASVAGRPGILPPAASWASRASHCQSSAGSAVHLNGVSMQKVDMPSGIPMMSSAMAAVTATGTQSRDVGKHVNKSDEDTIFREPKGRLELLEHAKGCQNINPRSSVPEISCTSAESSRMVSIGRIPSPSRHFDSSKLVDRVNVRSNTACLKDISVAADSKIDTSSSETIRSDKLVDCEDSEVGRRSGLGLNTTIHHRNQGNGHNCDPVNMQEHHVSLVSCKDERMTVTCVSHEASSWQADTQASDMKELPSEREHDIGGQCRLDAPVSDMNTSTPFPGFNNLQDRTLSNDADGLVNLGVNPPGVYKQDDDFLSNSESTPIGYLKSFVDCSSRIGSSSLVLNDGIENDQGRPGDKELNPRTDAIENSIISNILSLDLDAWDESLTSPQNLARLLGEPKIQQGPVSMPNSWKPQNSNQSRFSFARQEARSQVLEPEPSFCREVVNPHSFPPVFVGNGEPGLGRHANVLYHNFEPCDSFPGNQSVFSTCKFSVPRAQITAPPPGFSSPSRPPPPGFSVHDKTGRSFDFNSGNHFLDTNFLHKNQYQAPPTTNSSIAADIEFIDPAILAVGKGVIPTGFSSSNLDAQPNFSSHTSAFEQFLMQRTHGAHQSQRYGDIQDHYSLNNTYGFSSRDIESSQPSNMSSYLQFPFQQPRNGSNAHYDAWPDVHGGNNIGIADLLRGDRLGFNKLYGAQEDFQAPNSSDLYGRQFGM